MVVDLKEPPSGGMASGSFESVDKYALQIKGGGLLGVVAGTYYTPSILELQLVGCNRGLTGFKHYLAW